MLGWRCPMTSSIRSNEKFNLDCCYEKGARMSALLSPPPPNSNSQFFISTDLPQFVLQLGMRFDGLADGFFSSLHSGGSGCPVHPH